MAYSERIPPAALKAVAEQLGYFVAAEPGGQESAPGTRGLPRGGGRELSGGGADDPSGSGGYEVPTAGDEDVRCGESFALYRLEADKIYSYRPARAGGGDPLAALATDTGRWHLQIKFDGEARAFARSAAGEDKSGASDVREFFASPLAVSIGRAVKWIDAHVPERLRVRLLTVPSHSVEAFWLHDEAKDEGRVLVIEAPPSLQGLPTERLIGAHEFVEALARARPRAGFG